MKSPVKEKNRVEPRENGRAITTCCRFWGPSHFHLLQLDSQITQDRSYLKPTIFPLQAAASAPSLPTVGSAQAVMRSYSCNSVRFV